MKEKKRIAIYMRCTNNTATKYCEMHSRLTGYVKSQTNWELVEIFYDNAPSKWRTYPENMKRMLEAAVKHSFDIVVIEKMFTLSAHSQKRTDIVRILEEKGIKVITLYEALRAQRRAEKAKTMLQYEMLEDAVQRGECLTKEHLFAESKEKARSFIGYIDESFEEILCYERDAPYKRMISIHVGDKVCCIPLTARSLLALRDSVESMQQCLE